MPDIKPFSACLLMTHLLGCHIYHHNQGVAERKTYRPLAEIFSEDEQVSV